MMPNRPDSIRKRLGLPEKSRLQSAVDKSEMALQFLIPARDAAIERGDEAMRMCVENAVDAITELRLLAEGHTD
jgi:hypothetical protein